MRGRDSRSVEPDVIERLQHIQDSIVTLLPRLMARGQMGDRNVYMKKVVERLGGVIARAEARPRLRGPS